MKIRKPILIVLGEPNSVFIEILSKLLNKKKIKKKINYPIIIIGSKELFSSQLKILRKKLNVIDINYNLTKNINLKNKLYFINVRYRFKKPFEKISYKSKKYISLCFKIAFNYLNNGISDMLINGPVSKKNFFKNSYPGVTEYVFENSKKRIAKNPVMLIYNKKLSVSPITTHLPLKNVNKNINQKDIINNILTINNFYRNRFNKKIKIAVLGLNPHCETNSKFNEEKKIIIPAIEKLKKRKINISGPYAADTLFITENIFKFNCVVGMYHDQVLTPFKTMFGFNASNITLGLPFLRMSVDHGPNENMLGKNQSNSDSLENIFNFIDMIK